MKRPLPLAILLVVLATLAIRAPWFGDPVIDADEQFYLFAGDRWLHGALPYVDIWDRKPPGLFALFAAIRLLPGDGILAYQLVAACFVAATATTILLFARRIAPLWAATAAAIVYPLAIGWQGGMGGQSPVFYNLLVAGAAWLVAEAVVARSAGTGRGAAAMLLVGVALQLKYSALFEGLFLGLALLWAAWAGGARPARLAAFAALWIATALCPTLLAWGLFALDGHEAAFRFANFTSILLRQNEPAAYQLKSGAKMLARLLPELLPLAVGAAILLRRGARAAPLHIFLIGWAAAAAFGILIFGNYFNHYALPLIVPLAILLAPVFALRPRALGAGLAALALVANGVAAFVTWRHVLHRSGDRAYAEAIAGVIRANLSGGCLHVFNGEPILYHLTGACLATRWPFPYHLSFSREAAALGTDPVAEVGAILRRHPTVIVDTFDPEDPDPNPQAQRVLRAGLARHYRLVAEFRLRNDLRRVYALR